MDEENTSTSESSDSQTHTFPEIDYAPQIEQWYHVRATQMDSELDIGVSAPNEETWTIDDFPDAPYNELVNVAKGTLDFEQLKTSTGEENWPRVGRVTFASTDDGGVTMRVTWEPDYVR